MLALCSFKRPPARTLELRGKGRIEPIHSMLGHRQGEEVAGQEDLKRWVLDALVGMQSQATVPQIAKHIWDHHEAELRQSGDLFYTWQYAMRWAGQVLQQEGKLTKSGPNRAWKLVEMKQGN